MRYLDFVTNVGVRGGGRRARALIWLGLVAAGPAWAQPGPAAAPLVAEGSGAAAAAVAGAPAPSRANFAGEPASGEARRIADWVVASGDNLELPFMIVDKVGARVLAFDAHGLLVGAAPALLGAARGDVSPEGIGKRRLADIAPAERITPAGRFVATLGRDLGNADILWVDYESATSLHRVVNGKPSERRLQRLTTASTLDNRISYGCINVPVAFYEGVVRPIFKGTNGIVYVLPETKPLHEVFSIPAAGEHARVGQ